MKNAPSWWVNEPTWLAAAGLPVGEELDLLNKYRNQLPADLFTRVWLPPATDEKAALRTNLIKARDLLTEAGWSIKDGVLVLSSWQREVISLQL